MIIHSQCLIDYVIIVSILARRAKPFKRQFRFPVAWNMRFQTALIGMKLFLLLAFC